MRRRLVHLTSALIATAALASGVSGQGLPAPTTTPESLGFSRERLGRLDATMQKAVDDKEVAGVVTLVLRRGHTVQLKAFGMADRENNMPMRTDTIFRLASTSKIITTVALMQLAEQGQLLITEPVSKYIPALKNMTVAVPAPPGAPATAPAFTLVPAKRQISLHDLLTKTPGIAYASGPTKSLYEEAGFHDWYFADSPVPMCAMIERLGKLPAHAQPGERWMNGYTADILGCVIEKVTGMTLWDYERTHIFEPLKMSDTQFFLPKSKASRLAAVYIVGANGALKRADGKWTEGQGEYVEGQGPGVAFSGGAGLTSTISDFGRFLQMLLNGGELDGVRIVSRKTVELITANHVGGIYKSGTMGFGFNVEITTQPGGADRLGSLGDWGWSGAYFPRFVVDPSEKMVSVFMAQLTGYGRSGMHDRFLDLVYQGLIDSAPEPRVRMKSSASR
jgi:CubicO group peptidase (beta-lactamase class C family)